MPQIIYLSFKKIFSPLEALFFYSAQQPTNWTKTVTLLWSNSYQNQITLALQT